MRLTLGASAGAIGRQVVAQGLKPAFVGLLVGLGLAALSVGALGSLLYEVRPLDPWTFAGAAFLLLLAAALACTLPAWRATTVDPAQTLRAE